MPLWLLKMRGFWKKRDPTKTTLENERIAVHYERLADCWEHYVQPSRRRDLSVPNEDVCRMAEPPGR